MTVRPMAGLAKSGELTSPSDLHDNRGHRRVVDFASPFDESRSQLRLISGRRPVTIPPMRKDRSLQWVPFITAEKVDAARRELGLGETATQTEFKARYRELARRYHPDARAESGSLDERDRFRRISNANSLLNALIRHYRYSLRLKDIRRDQEDAAIRDVRQFGGGLYSESGQREEALAEFHRRHPEHVTAENVERAARILGLGPTATRVEIDLAHRRLVRRDHPDRVDPANRTGVAGRFHDVVWAHRVLTRLVEGYRYSFRIGDVRRDQEDPLATHRRQFANDPVWAGGEFDEKCSRRRESGDREM